MYEVLAFWVRFRNRTRLADPPPRAQIAGHFQVRASPGPGLHVRILCTVHNTYTDLKLFFQHLVNNVKTYANL
jgi:hypothetical protein